MVGNDLIFQCNGVSAVPNSLSRRYAANRLVVPLNFVIGVVPCIKTNTAKWSGGSCLPDNSIPASIIEPSRQYINVADYTYFSGAKVRCNRALLDPKPTAEKSPAGCLIVMNCRKSVQVSYSDIHKVAREMSRCAYRGEGGIGLVLCTLFFEIRFSDGTDISSP